MLPPPLISFHHLSVCWEICSSWPRADQRFPLPSILPRAPPDIPSSAPGLLADYANVTQPAGVCLPETHVQRPPGRPGRRGGKSLCPSPGAAQRKLFSQEIIQQTDGKRRGRSGNTENKTLVHLCQCVWVYGVPRWVCGKCRCNPNMGMDSDGRGAWERCTGKMFSTVLWPPLPNSIFCKTLKEL